MAPFYRFNSLMDFGDPLRSIDSVRKEVHKWGAIIIRVLALTWWEMLNCGSLILIYD